jgi:hypothetical protein
MDTTPDPNQASPRQVLLDSADEELAHAQEQLTRAGEEMARAEEHLSRLEHDAARGVRERSSLGGRAARGFTGLVLAAGVLRRYGQAHRRKVDAAARHDCIADAR